MTTKVPVELTVTQVKDGSHYKGHLKIDDTEFNYELVFGISINQLDSLEPITEENELRQLFQITVSRDKKKIELTMEEYCFFLSMIVETVVGFYNNPQTRANNDGLVGAILNGTISASILGPDATLSIGMTSKGLLESTPKLCEILSAPKFGCVLVAT